MELITRENRVYFLIKYFSGLLSEYDFSEKFILFTNVSDEIVNNVTQNIFRFSDNNTI